ncbi:MAG TPA: AI-2E family transporter [Acidimicrobiales bacterium]|jgi:predicted PurR-regulated permease PerM|nr:AI-2E family transporter [Acidimicrobiales bacterium]
MTDPVAGGEDKATGNRGSRWQRMLTSAQDKGVPLRTILTIDAVVVITWVAYRLLGRLREIILWILIAGFIALVLNPAVVFLQRHRRSRGQAVGIVFLVALLAFIGLLGLFGYPLVNALSHFATKLPSMVNQLEKGHGSLARTLQHFHLLTWVQTNAPKLQQAAQKLGKPALSVGANVGKAVLSTMLALFTIAFLSLFMLIYAPNMRSAVLRTMEPKRRQTVEEVGTRVSQAVTSYVLGTVALSLAFGVVVFVTLAILGVPFALLIGLWVALVAMIPLVGGLIAAIPSVLIALLHSPTAALVMLVVFIGFQLIENHFLYPIVMARTVRMNPLLVLLSVLIGAQLGGVFGSALGALAGALAAIPVGAAIQVIVKEVWLETRAERESGEETPSLRSGLAPDSTRPESPHPNGIDRTEDPAPDDREPVP